ncbi:MAG: beta-ketoacyl-ACP synthase III [Limisphaerales bacterium]
MTLPVKKFKNPRARHNFRGQTCSIISVGFYVPDRILNNADLEEMVDTSNEWILTRTGIKERRIAAKHQITSDLAAAAAISAMRRGKIHPSEIDLIVLATITPDMPFPSTACIVQEKIGAHHAAAFDVQAACSGFIYGLEIGQQFIMSRTYETVLVIGAEKLSSIINWTDRNTCVLFGDGAGAAILRNRSGAHGLLTVCMKADGRMTGLLCMPGGGSACPPSAESIAAGLHYLRMDGKETFKRAVTAMTAVANEALRRCELDISEIQCIIPHQANRRIIDAVAERLGAKPEQLFVNVEKYGNTSAGSVAIALAEAVECGRIQRGDLVLLVVFGAGLTWGAAVIEW